MGSRQACPHCWLDRVVAEKENDQDEVPLVPAYVFNAPGQPILLYSGPLKLSAEGNTAGAVHLRCAPGLDVIWQVDEEESRQSDDIAFDENQVDLHFEFAHGEQVISGRRRGLADGRLDHATIGSDGAPLKRVLVHWMNLPAMCGPIMLRQSVGDGWTNWTGRWRVVVGDWLLTWDQRRDHGDVWDAIGEERSIVMTHVAEIRRVDDGEFTAAEFQPLLKTLHFGLSFSLGRWVAPALPVGFDAHGRRVWAEWAPWLCDPGRNGSLAWWFYPRVDDLKELLNRAYAAFVDPDRAETVRMLMAMAVQSNQAGFVEQRVMSAFSGLELLCWVVLKLTQGIGNREYDRLRASGRLRRLLTTGQISTVIDSAVQPGLARFAEDEAGQDDQSLDGPAAVAQVRNRLVHPKMPQDSIYRTDGLIVDAWLLTRHYLNQLILHWIGYTGSYQTFIGPGGWVGDVDPVPWAES